MNYYRYGGIRGSYQHFGGQGGQDSGFPSPRSALGYPFPPMHQNSYSGYHLGSYAPPCSSPPKDGMYKFIYQFINHSVWRNPPDLNACFVQIFATLKFWLTVMPNAMLYYAKCTPKNIHTHANLYIHHFSDTN